MSAAFPIIQTAGAQYRLGINAADVLSAPGTVTCTLQAGGSASAGTYNVKVVAGNPFGRTTATPGNTTVITSAGNLTGRAAFAGVAGATYYDIYFSTDADPKWVGRITEAQRASGIVITAVGVTGAGGTAGAVDVQVPGTGGQSATTAAVNTAYAIPAAAPINANGFEVLALDLTASRTGDSATITLSVIVVALSTRTVNYVMLGSPVTLTFGGGTGNPQPLIQRITSSVRGATSIHLLVTAISGTGASVDVDYSLS